MDYVVKIMAGRYVWKSKAVELLFSSQTLKANSNYN